MPTIFVPAGVAEGGKGQHVGVLVDIKLGVLQGRLQPLQLGRKNTLLQVHGGRRVLHRPVVHDDQLLNVFGNGCLGIAGKLGRLRERSRERQNGNGKKTLVQSSQ